VLIPKVALFRGPFRRTILAILATLFAASTLFYGGVWMYSAIHGWVLFYQLLPPPPWSPQAGANLVYDLPSHSEILTFVAPGSPADLAGLRTGDRILAINGQQLDDARSLLYGWLSHQNPGQTVQLTIQRGNAPLPLAVSVFRVPGTPSEKGRIEGVLSQEIMNSYPVALIVVGLAVLFLRLEAAHAWLLALMFAGFVALPNLAETLSPFSVRGQFLLFNPLWRFVRTYNVIFGNMLPPLFFFFFSVFPVRSPLDRRLPWLKWVFLILGFCVVLAVFSGWANHGYTLLYFSLFHYGLLALGIVSLVWNAFSAKTPEAHRKIRVILWGTLVGVVPGTLLVGARDVFRIWPPLWAVPAVVVLFWLFPLSFAYAIVKHRVMDIPVLLRRSVRYMVVQRGFYVLLFLATACTVALFTRVFSRYFPTGSNIGMLLSAAFGIALVWTLAPLVKRATERIDKAFFRQAYDARIILQDLADNMRTMEGCKELATLLEHHVRQALQPKSLACYFDDGTGRLAAISGDGELAPASIPVDAPVLAELQARGKAWSVRAFLAGGAVELPVFTALEPECLVPILGRKSGLIGLLVLGPRLSEEPYSGEDKRLLDSVAGQAGMTLENIRLAEKMAERMEAERRRAHEMEIAREVQTRLFPPKLPATKTLEFTGDCIPAREVGGDYYDFLAHREGRVALVLADVAGKGVSAALLMANLQASLRSHYAMAVDDMPHVLTSVNHSFCKNTGEATFATLFFADYDDASRILRYANCGHLPPLLLGAQATAEERASGRRRVERLDATCTVVGLFKGWECEIAEVALVPGDTLVLYTDGITEARSADGEEFGESRLLDTLRSHCDLAVGPLLQEVVDTVKQFSAGEQHDDITLVIARCFA
jgi:sigma-B regulation protein RsbU (phosphoserine phosphatase)